MDFGHIVDRIAILSSEIHDRASYSTNSRSNYAESILSKPLSTYVREAESVESRMFTVSRPPPGEVATSVDLKKVDTVNASPLKKAREAPLAILEPQEYVRSVIRLGEKYDVMPRAQAYARELLGQAEGYEKRIAALERSLKEGEKAAGPASPRKKGRSLKDEERLTREAEARAASLRDQRQRLLEQLNGAKEAIVSDTSVFASPSAMSAKGGGLLMTNLLDNSIVSAAEAPPPKKRTLAQEIQARRAARQANRKPNNPDATKPSLSSGPTVKESAFWSSDNAPDPDHVSHSLESGTSITASTEPSDSDLTEGSTVPVNAAQGSDPEAETETGDEDGEADVTLVLSSNKQSSRSAFSLLRRSTLSRNVPQVVGPTIEPPPPPLPTSVPAKPQNESAASQPPAPPPQVIPEPRSPVMEPPQVEEQAAPPEPETAASSSSINPTNPEVEIQMGRVWRTVGEIILPENSYTKGGTSPSTQTTLHILQSISTLPTKTDDPTGSASEAVLTMLATHRSQSATSSLAPTPLQVITASAVLQLLAYVIQNASSPAEDGLVWMPQNTLKAELKAHPWAVEAMTKESVDWMAKVMVKLVPSRVVVLDRRKGLIRFGRE